MTIKDVEIVDSWAWQ